jgi:hypothetical protein
MVLDFGKEDKSFLTSDDLKGILTCHFRGICKLVKLIYFNDNYQYNNTIRYINNDNKNIEIIENGFFRIINKEYVLDSIILDLWSILYNYYNEMEINSTIQDYKETLVCSVTWDRITEFIKSYHKFLDGEYNSIEDMRKDIFNIIKLSTIEIDKKKRKNKKHIIK